MKESDNTENLGSIVIPKARGVPNSLFHVSTLKETKDISIGLPCVGRAVHYRFFSRSFTLTGPLWTWERPERHLPSNGFACSWRIRWCKFHLGRGLHPYVTIVLLNACSLLSLYKSIFLLLALRSAVTLKFLGF